MNTNNKHINLNFYKNFVYFSVKKTLKTLLMIILYFSLTNTSIACEFLKEKIGTPVSNIIEKYDDEDSKYLQMIMNNKIKRRFLN